MRKLLVVPVLFLLMVSCGRKEWKQTDDGVLLRLQPASPAETSMLKVSVVTDRIIRVTAVPGKSFSDAKSLIVVDQAPVPPFTVTGEEGFVTVAAAEVRAKVSLATGQVTFLDGNGNLITSEREGGRSFSPIEVE
ncbi:MAG TPA: DUF4968 domain-containing protein, partial [Prolixibacteraceae bacterium]|nr:DUF4968 domain-containing protein [Prolixibacteraceae bacterium]